MKTLGISFIGLLRPLDMIKSRGMRYKADITAGALKLPESRLIADLLLRQADAEAWKDATTTKKVLRAPFDVPVAVYPGPASGRLKCPTARAEMRGCRATAA